jgi:hypothetical protein
MVVSSERATVRDRPPGQQKWRVECNKTADDSEGANLTPCHECQLGLETVMIILEEWRSGRGRSVFIHDWKEMAQNLVAVEPKPALRATLHMALGRTADAY